MPCSYFIASTVIQLIVSYIEQDGILVTMGHQASHSTVSSPLRACA